MAKGVEELAAEITIAWLQASGNACATGKLGSQALNADNVSKAYEKFFKAIVDSAREM